MKLAVCIPSYKGHVPFLRDCLDSIVAQTRLPDHVFVRVSSCDASCDPILDSLRLGPWPFPLIINTVNEIQNAAENRNALLNIISDEFEYISFFDSDDVMHPYRLDYIYKTFITTNTDIVLHDYFIEERNNIQWNMNEQYTFIEVTPEINSEYSFNPFKNTSFLMKRAIFLDKHGNVFGGANGHVSVHRKTYTNVQFNTDTIGYEDSQYLSDLVFYNYSCVILPSKLSAYVPSTGPPRPQDADSSGPPQ